MGEHLLAGVKAKHYRAILADPPWHFEPWALDEDKPGRHAIRHYQTMPIKDIQALPVCDVAARNCALFMWVIWPMLTHGLETISAWGFKYKTCAFAWMKADGTQVDMFVDDYPVQIGGGYWTRSNSEICLLATRGHPQRLNADVRQGIIAPRREHSRKPDGVHGRIERLVAGPYLELFGRAERKGWTVRGDEVGKFK